MGRVIASYLARITIREPDVIEEGAALEAPPTVAQVEFALEAAISELLGLESPVNVTAERVDK